MKYFKLLLWLLLPFTINARYKPTWESLDSRPDAHGTFQMPGLKNYWPLRR